MPDISVCIEMIFRELPFCERFEAVKSAGFAAAEMWGWNGRNLEEMKSAIDNSGVCLSSMCVGTKNEELAAEYSACPLVCDGSASVFTRIVHDSIEAANYLGVKNLIVTTGQERVGVSREAQHNNIVKALKAAAPMLEDAGITAVLEPLNILVDHKGYYLSTSLEAAEILDEVGSKSVKMLFDIYHQQITEGNIINNISRYIDKIGHFHVADNPGRHEPGTGELNYARIFKTIDSLGYTGYVGLEFSPTTSDTQALSVINNIGG